ncbi:MAG: ATP-binding cassette domain-containing protein [Desulfobacterales bacterium]|nr:ATP-binding cassette domain-containing protein [Desulfobacterales bacterium]
MNKAPAAAFSGPKDGAPARESDPGGAPVFLTRNVRKVWPGETDFVLTIPELVARPAEKMALVGFSGCGKSTLLDLLALILRPDEAGCFMFHADPDPPLDVIGCWQDNDLNRLALTRMQRIGYVLQTGGLLPFLSVGDNIRLSRQALGLADDGYVEALAERLGIRPHLKKFPSQISVGERQRVAIARAMAHEPAVVMADEPTASLDPFNAERIMRLFTDLVEDRGVTLIVATHEWDRVRELGFRRVRFELDRETDRSVHSRVIG